MRVVGGIDWSLRCPGLCIHVGDTWSPDNCHFFYAYGVKKWLANGPKIKSILQPEEFESAEVRIDWLTDWYMEHILNFPGIQLYIENYSYSSGSSSTHILAEATGVLKHKLHMEGLKIVKFSPGEIKKFGNGKGNATKDMMARSFVTEKSWLSSVLPFPEGKSPMADLIDAYYIAKLGFSQL